MGGIGLRNWIEILLFKYFVWKETSAPLYQLYVPYFPFPFEHYHLGILFLSLAIKAAEATGSWSIAAAHSSLSLHM